MISKKTTKGNVTILLTLTLTAIVCIIFTILESARITSTKTHCTDISYLSTASLFGNYCMELFEEYGLFAVNSSDTNFEEYIMSITKENLSPGYTNNIFSANYNLLSAKVDNIEFISQKKLTDNDGSAFFEQVKKYMKYKEVSDIAESIISATDSMSVDIRDFTDKNQAALRFRTLDLIQLDMALKYNETFNINSCICGADIKYTYYTQNIFFTPYISSAKKSKNYYDIKISYEYK